MPVSMDDIVSDPATGTDRIIVSDGTEPADEVEFDTIFNLVINFVIPHLAVVGGNLRPIPQKCSTACEIDNRCRRNPGTSQ